MFDWLKPPHQRENYKSRDFLNSKDAKKVAASTTPVLLEIVGAMGLSCVASTQNASWRQLDSVVKKAYAVVKVKTRTTSSSSSSSSSRGGATFRYHEVHRTRPIYDDENPIWTLKNDNITILQLQDELKKNDDKNDDDDRVTIQMYDGSRCLGTVTLSYETLVSGTGERLEFNIVPLSSQDKEYNNNDNEQEEEANGALLAIKFRKALPDEIEFVQARIVNKIPPKPRPPAWASDINFRHVRGKDIMKSYQKYDHATGQDLYRVQPCPDPTRPTEVTEFMTRKQMQDESMKPSYQWITAGKGDMGKLYVEILGCDNLPNMDMVLHDYTDAFVALLFEDTMVRTPVYWDDLNPKFMPWTSRAFQFNIQHSTALLTLAVFDYDDAPLDHHDPIGRVVINTANFRANMTYVLQYRLELHPNLTAATATANNQETPGTITIRLRLEWNDQRAAIQQSFHAPPRYLINVDNDKSYHVLKYLTRGAVDMDMPQVKTVRMYANEFFSYWYNYCFVLDVLLEALLWRGRVQITPTWSVWCPTHSVVMFVSVLVLIERPTWFVPVIAYLCCFILLSINYSGSRHPNPWKRVKYSWENNVTALLGYPLVRPFRIEPGQGVVEGSWVDRIDRIKSRRIAALISASLYFLLKVYRINNKTSETSIQQATKDANWDLFKNQLYYVHLFFKYQCKYIRLWLNFINWKGYGADVWATRIFWFATLWWVLRLNTVTQWTCRILAWAVLGPWTMKYIDVKYFQHWYYTRDEVMRRVQAYHSLKRRQSSAKLNVTELLSHDSSRPMDPSQVEKKNDDATLGMEELVDFGKQTEDDEDKEVALGMQMPDFDALLENDTIRAMTESGRRVAEHGLQLRDFRDYRFGAYAAVVPPMDNSPTVAIPLPTSYATPYYPNDDDDDDKKKETDDNAGADHDDAYANQNKIWYHVNGQTLDGDIILKEVDDTVLLQQKKAKTTAIQGSRGGDCSCSDECRSEKGSIRRLSLYMRPLGKHVYIRSLSNFLLEKLHAKSQRRACYFGLFSVHVLSV